jgi:hypothetical protein
MSVFGDGDPCPAFVDPAVLPRNAAILRRAGAQAFE